MAGHDPSLTPDQAWYSAWPHSGGLQGIGSHAIDQCRFLVGEIKSVSALVRTFNPDRAIPSAGDPEATADEGTAAVLEFENGAIGVLESSVVATGRKNFLSWEINGSKGSLRWDLEHPNSLFACLTGRASRSLLGFTEISVTESDHPYVGPWWPHGHNIGWEHCHIIEKFHFLDAVANGKPMSPYNATFEDGYRVAVDHRRHAAIESLRKQGRARLEPDTMIPSEKELMDLSGVGRATVRRAISDLAQEGFLQTHQRPRNVHRAATYRGGTLASALLATMRVTTTSDGLAFEYTLRHARGDLLAFTVALHSGAILEDRSSADLLLPATR